MTDDGSFALFDAPAPKGKSTGGPVYQGVNKQVKALFPDHTTDLEVGARYARLAGIVAQARSLAASIDRAAAPPRPASGHQLSLMHGQLADLLERLDPDGAAAPASDPFAELQRRLDAGADGWADAGHRETSHPA